MYIYKKDHIARKCRSKVAYLGPHSSSEDIDYLSNLRPQQTHLVDTVPLLTMDMNTFSVSVQLYGIPFIALIDTGSSISAISQDTWIQISHLASVKLACSPAHAFQREKRVVTLFSLWKVWAGEQATVKLDPAGRSGFHTASGTWYLSEQLSNW